MRNITVGQALYWLQNDDLSLGDWLNTLEDREQVQCVVNQLVTMRNQSAMLNSLPEPERSMQLVDFLQQVII